MSRVFWSSLFLCLIAALLPRQSYAKKVELDDIQIKGELHNDNRLRFYQRNRAKLENRVRIRSEFRDRIRQRYPQLDEDSKLLEQSNH